MSRKKKLDPGMGSTVYNPGSQTMSSKASEKQCLRSGELAKLADVSSDTLRHYERRGLLARPRRSRNGYREYPASALDRVRLIRRALGVGFTLEELSRILAVRDRGGAPCHQVRALAGTKLTEVETQLRELAGLRGELRKLLKTWDALLENKPASERAGLLETLVTDSSTARTRSSPLMRRSAKRKKESKENQW
jgi:DNA-binding transcriptional MerR regulator